MGKVKYTARDAYVRAAEALGCERRSWRRSGNNEEGAAFAVLLYHRVVPKEWEPGVCSLPEIVTFRDTFDRHMDWVSKDYAVISGGELLERKKKGLKIPDRAVVITFDDGWEDNYLFAAPVLKKYGLPATIFLTTGRMGSKSAFWQERLLFAVREVMRESGGLEKILEEVPNPLREKARAAVSGSRLTKSLLPLIQMLKAEAEDARCEVLRVVEAAADFSSWPGDRNGILTWAQCEEMAAQDIEFGSHGVSHRLLTTLPEGEVDGELAGSAAEIEMKLGGAPRMFAFPGGAHNSKIRERVLRAGYETALTVKPGLNRLGEDPSLVKRVDVNEWNMRDRHGRLSPRLFKARIAALL
ncbi:polysaccharide deacetylase family protein [Candidatus Moduliflexota bacterium]